MSKTSPTVKDRYNRKAYDRLNIFIPKGQRDVIQAHAADKGTSVNGLVNDLLRADLGVSEDEWRHPAADLEDATDDAD